MVKPTSAIALLRIKLDHLQLENVIGSVCHEGGCHHQLKTDPLLAKTPIEN